MAPRLHVGTSGWHYKHWRGPFYPPELPVSRWLSHYVRFFDTVELNNSFYNLPAASTFEGWRRKVPEGFLFAVKANRYLTHLRKLKPPKESLDRFFQAAEALGPSLGPVLFQMPPGWRKDADRLKRFLAMLPRDRQFAFEWRDPSWLDDDTFGLLRSFNAALCLHDHRGSEPPPVLTADFAYIRQHSPTEHAYRGSYPEEALAGLAGLIRSWPHLRDVYVYYNNDAEGHAVRNALRLKELLGVREPDPVHA